MPLLIFAVISAVVAAVDTFSKMEADRKQKEYEAQVARNNAEARQQQADITRQKTEVAQRAKAEEQQELKREYRSAAGTNRSLLAAGNVDITSGSALDLLEGNYNRFADDMGELEYEKAIVGWEGSREAQLQEFEADKELAQASYLEQTAGSLGTSLLASGISGVGAGASSYASTKGFQSTAPTSTSKLKIVGLGGK